MDGMTVLWIVVGVIVVLILLALLVGAAKKSNQRSNEQVAREHELQTRATTAHADVPPVEAGLGHADERQAEAGVVPADEQPDAKDEQQGESLQPGAAVSGEPDRATTPHTATWGAEVSGGSGTPAPVRPDDAESAPQQEFFDVPIDEEGDGCPSDMDSEHFGGVVDAKHPQ
jgi:hypothetical protein